MSWLNSEVTNGHFPDEDAKAHFYEKSITIGYIFLLIFIPFYAWLIDKVSMKISTIVGLAIRATLFYLVYRIEDPETQKAYFYTVVPLLNVAGYFVSLSLGTYLLRMYPKNIRGMCLMTQHIFDVAGGTVFPSMF